MAAEVTTKITIVIILSFSLALVHTTRVEMTQEWRPDFGWDVTCSWTLYRNDSLQSVKLSRNKQQFMIFRPENQPGSLNKKQSWNLVESILNVECMDEEESGVRGKCIFNVEPIQPPKQDITFGCEVSGERPYFRMDEKEVVVQAIVAPTDAEMSVSRQGSGIVSLNCTSSGLPAPTIVWTIDNQKIPHNFHGTPTWNATSKLWGVWSSFSPQSEDLTTLMCTPEVSKGNQVLKGRSAQYNSAKRISGLGTVLTIAISTLLR